MPLSCWHDSLCVCSSWVFTRAAQHLAMHWCTSQSTRNSYFEHVRFTQPARHHSKVLAACSRCVCTIPAPTFSHTIACRSALHMNVDIRAVATGCDQHLFVLWQYCTGFRIRAAVGQTAAWQHQLNITGNAGH